MTFVSPIVRWGLARPRLIAAACVWFLICGALYVRDTPVDLLPALAPASATITTDAPGLVAEQVEQSVTLPIERALVGAAGVAHVESRSLQGLSVVTVRFAAGAEPYRARQSVSETLARVAGLPPGVSPPRVSPLAAPDARILQIGFTSAKLDPMALRDLVQWTIRPRLLSATGVARVTIHGGQIRRLEVRARPGDLSDSDLGFLDILAATRRATSIAGAGFIDTPNQRVLIEPHGQAHTIDEIGAGQIQTAGAAPVRIADVADVVEAPAPALGDALIDGKPGVLLTVDRQFDANTLAVTRAVEDALSSLRPALDAQDVQIHGDLDRPAGFIAGAVRGVLFDLLVGMALVAVAIAVFMRDVRAAAIALAAIPLSLLASVMMLKALGLTLNAMTIGGLVVALGLVIDDAVIDVENLLARLRNAETRHASRRDAILAASLEMRGPVVYGTLAMALSLLPLLALRGPEGALLIPLAGAILAASLASLIVAAMVTPALAGIFLRHIQPTSEPRLIGRAKAVHALWLRRAAAKPWPALLASLIVGLLAIFACFLFRSEFVPSVHDGHLVIATDAPPSTSPEAMRDLGARISSDLSSISGVKSVSERIGRDASDDGDGEALEHGIFDVSLAPRLSGGAQTALIDQVRRRLAGFQGLGSTVRTRFEEERSGDPAAAPLTVEVFGSDLDAIDAESARAAEVLEGLPGAGVVQAPRIARAPTVRIDIDFSRLALFGLSAADVLDTIQAAFAGETVAQIYEGPRVVDLAVSAQADLRRDPEAVGNLLLRSTSGISVPLRSVAKVYLADGRAIIEHESSLRRDRIEASPSPGALAAFTDRARAAIARHAPPPPGVFLEFAAVDDAARVRGNLEAAYAVAIFAIFGLLCIAFDGRTAALVLFSSLFSLVGAVIAVALTGGVFSLGAMLGLIALFGLSMRGAILLISRTEYLVLERSAPWSLSTVVRAAHERAIPVIATALLVILAIAPMAVRAGAAGHEILGPMAAVIIGGLISATIGNLMLAPILVFAFWRHGGVRASD